MQEKRAPQNLIRGLETWNRKFHIYLGLYFLLFIWLFSVSGLLLNHPRWKFPQFWPQRELTSFERAFQAPTATGDMAVAQDLMRQIGINGEIFQLTNSLERGLLTFRILKPKTRFLVKADMNAQQATIEQIRVNGWGVLNALHLFSGVRMENPELKRDWFWTKLWSFSMDALAVGLIVMVFGGLYMWYQLKPKRGLGLVALALGIMSCGYFVFGLSRLP